MTHTITVPVQLYGTSAVTGTVLVPGTGTGSWYEYQVPGIVNTLPVDIDTMIPCRYTHLK